MDEVSTALQSASDENKEHLEELQLNLITILELTLAQLDQIQKDDEKAKTNSNLNTDKNDSAIIDEEFRKFQVKLLSLMVIINHQIKCQ